MSINIKHLEKCLTVLDSSLAALKQSSSNSTQYDVFRNATIKSFELGLETSNQLLRRALKQFMGDPQSIEQMTYKSVLRHAAKHHLLSTQSVERWFQYRDNRSEAAYDYDQDFFEETLLLIPQFLEDARALQNILVQVFGQDDRATD